ncbi:MAG: histone deacetylase family protein, partial [Thaumarchaeota archaeon]|nr:histone deacetylase family protein [Nitrososphaerota archaeon]
MKVIFHEDYRKVYSSDPAAAPGRIEAILRELMDLELVEPEPAGESDVQLVHTPSHISYVKGMPQVYEIALLAAGGAIKASEIALGGEPAFAVIR